MPLRVGIDLVAADSVREALARHGDRYLERVYTAQEIADCGNATGVDPERLAGRFAAKEATFKVLRAGDEPLPWREVEVRRHPTGWVELLLTGQAATLAREAGIVQLALSIAHEQGFATAVVVAETSP
jgi:holo-[acyl-carrier protein] synthase